MSEESVMQNTNPSDFTPNSSDPLRVASDFTPKSSNISLITSKYICNNCDASFSRKDNLLRHKRQRCKINLTTYNCKHCSKTFKYASGVSRHESGCKTKNDDNMHKLVDLLNNQLEEQRNQLQEERNQLQEERNQLLQERTEHQQERTEHTQQIDKQYKHMAKQQKQIDVLIKKAGITINNNITINNTLLSHKNTSAEHLTDADYKQCISRCLRCIPRLIEKVYFNPAAPGNHNIYISNLKNNYATLFNGTKWMITDRDTAIIDLIDNNERLVEEKLEEWEETGNVNYAAAMEKFGRYMNRKEDDFVLNRLKSEIKLVLFNNRDIVEAIK